MADSTSSDSSEDDLMNVVYVCRKCDGKEFTSNQKAAHEEYHRRQRLQKKKRLIVLKIYILIRNRGIVDDK